MRYRPGRGSTTAPAKHRSPQRCCEALSNGRSPTTCPSVSGRSSEWSRMQPGGWSHQTGLKSVGAAYRQLCAITAASVSSCSPEGVPAVNRSCLMVGCAMRRVPRLSVARTLITGTCCGRFRTQPPPFMKARSKREVSSGSMCT